jgi:hypothetical protein
MAKRLVEVTVDVGGKAYTLALDINAMCAVEDLMSTEAKTVSFQEVATLAMRNSMRHVRALTWGALRKHHKDMTLEQVGAWMFEVDSDPDVAAKVQAQMAGLLGGAQPDPEDTQALGVKPSRPRKARAV